MLAYLQGSNGEQISPSEVSALFGLMDNISPQTRAPSTSQSVDPSSPSSKEPASTRTGLPSPDVTGTSTTPTSSRHLEPVSIQKQQPSFDRERLTMQLLQVVSERTGYPSDMLGLDLNIEADLGIDSIKRVEILRRPPADISLQLWRDANGHGGIDQNQDLTEHY